MPSPYRNKSSKKPVPKRKPVVSPDSKSSQSPANMAGRYQRENKHPSGVEWDRKKAVVLDHYNGICHLCGHPGAQQVDHVEVYAEHQDDSIPNLRPAHGSAGTKQKNRCPVCGLNCNNIRGSLSVAAAKRKIERRIEEGRLAPPPPEVVDGRDW